ncbi:MAG: GIY-YIG nuclease family protein [Bacteroidetes bacterium]|nr:GIY-YIG nuclease family protein [Bacteroidota bacterium]
MEPLGGLHFYVYVLQSKKDQRFYFGQSTNILKRLEKHNKVLRML